MRADVGEAMSGRIASHELPALAESGAGQDVGVALALFEERPSSRRRVGAAEARSKARRCPTCQGFVPAGMSLCSACGLDLETGRRVAPLDLLDDLAPEPTARPEGLPVASAIVGGLAAVGGLALLVGSLVGWLGGSEASAWLAPVGAFGIHGAFQFLRGKSGRPLLAALSLAAVLDVVLLIGAPIVAANLEAEVVRVEPSDASEPEGEAIRPVADRLDAGRIGLGIAGLFVYASASAYLLSPTARRHLGAGKSA